MALYKVQCRYLANMLVNLSVLLNTDNFLTNWATINFSKRALIRGICWLFIEFIVMPRNYECCFLPDIKVKMNIWIFDIDVHSKCVYVTWNLEKIKFVVPLKMFLCLCVLNMLFWKSILTCREVEMNSVR